MEHVQKNIPFQYIDTKPSPNKNRKHAIVIGGLLAARVLADAFERVTIIERDHYPDTPSPRAGAPQSHHFHYLLQRGFLILSALFPTLTLDLKALGTLAVIPTTPPFVSIYAHKKVFNGPTNREVFFIEPVKIEWRLYRQLIRRPEIHIRTNWEVTELIATTTQEQAQIRVTGIQIRARGPEARIDRLNADLVVDASGRNSQLLIWLEERHFALPSEERIASGLGYATRYYKKPEHVNVAWYMMRVHSAAPHIPRSGALSTIMPGIWQVTVSGMAGNYPPTDEAGFRQWLRNLVSPDLYNVLQNAEPISPIRGFRLPKRFCTMPSHCCSRITQQKWSKQWLPVLSTDNLRVF